MFIYMDFKLWVDIDNLRYSIANFDDLIDIFVIVKSFWLKNLKKIFNINEWIYLTSNHLLKIKFFILN